MNNKASNFPLIQECLDTGFDFVAAPLRRAVQHNLKPLSHKTALLVPTPVSTQVLTLCCFLLCLMHAVQFQALPRQAQID